jgi:hypothetical protein
MVEHFLQQGMSRSYAYDEATGEWVDFTDIGPETPARPDTAAGAEASGVGGETPDFGNPPRHESRHTSR